MEADRFARLKEILLQAADLSEVERRQYLDAACQDDRELRREVESMLAHESDPTRIVPTDPSGSSARLDSHPDRIGPYKILEPIGEGGMGVVYLAEQTEPVKRRVALKVIKAGMDSKQVVARFESERQALALMDHPAIAKVLDAGTTPQGRPFFAMDYVPGIPITEYCDRRRLGTKERLELFQRVCEGVQHAHQKALIHRDLKPSNILVADVDGKPQPRIIDFGVAKATTQKLTEKTMYTALGQLIGTPEYMSPEQADLTVEDIDTRTDVYSLGVILYELLAGALPFDSTQLRQAGFEGIIKLLREKDPMRPSTKVSSLGGQTSEIAEKRHTEPRRLAGELKGDLDWIVMRSMEKDRNRRYGSPQEFAQDIQRHLDHQPVLAGPPSATYRAKKFVKRNRVAVGFGATIMLAVAAGFILLTVQNAKIAAARDEAESVVTTLEEMLASVDPTKSGRDVTVKEMLDETAKTLGEKFKDQPLIEARLRYTVGETYKALGEYETAEEHLLRSVEIRRERLGNKNPETLGGMCELATVYYGEGRYEEAEALQRKTMETARRVLGEDHIQTLASMDELAAVYFRQGRYDEAEALLGETLEVRRRVLGTEHKSTVRTMMGLAVVFWVQNRCDEAEALQRKTLMIQRRVLGAEHPETVANMKNLALTCAKLGRYAEAETLFSETLEIQRRVLGEEHSGTLWTMQAFCQFYSEQGRDDEAVALAREVFDIISRRAWGEENPSSLDAMHTLGKLYCDKDRFDEAEVVFLKIAEISGRVLGEEHKRTLHFMCDLGMVYSYQGRHHEAEETLRQALEISRRAFGEEDPTTNITRHYLACSEAVRGRRDEAISYLKEALEHGYDGGPSSGILDTPDLASLRGDPEAEAIAQEMKRRREEGARAKVEW